MTNQEQLEELEKTYEETKSDDVLRVLHKPWLLGTVSKTACKLDGSIARKTYEQWSGIKLQTKQHVCHRCDNSKCSNLSHIFIGDIVSNKADLEIKLKLGTFVCKSGINTERDLLDLIKSAVKWTRHKWPRNDEFESVAIETIFEVLNNKPDAHKHYIMQAIRWTCHNFSDNEDLYHRTKKRLKSEPAMSEVEPRLSIEEQVDEVYDPVARGLLRMIVQHHMSVSDVLRVTNLKRKDVEKTLGKLTKQEDWKSIREDLGLSIDQFAKAAGFLTPTVQRFEEKKLINVKDAKALQTLYRKIAGT